VRPGIVATTDVAEACKDVMSKNVSIYKAQASALEQYAAKDVKAIF
jgi:malate dehydrogenase